MKARMVSWSCLLACVLSVARAAVAGPDEVDAIEKKAMAAFALAHYAEAADGFEKAFALKPEPGLLYNAAQAHRLAGQKERALALYENYARVFGKHEHRAEVDNRIAELKQAIAQEKAGAATPPQVAEKPPATKTEPPGPPDATAAPAATVAPAAVLVAPQPAQPAATQPAGVVIAQPATTDDQRPLIKKPWFWVAVGGGVAVVVVSVLLLSGGSKDPTPSIGHANGN